MGLLDDLTGEAGGLAGWIQNNPQVVAAAVSMLSNRQGSVGGTGGLGSLINAFGRGGLGDAMSSWIGGGPNQAVSADELSQALGPDLMKQFGQAAGLSHGESGSALSELLPALINGLTPNGQVPQSGHLEDSLSGLLRGLGQ